MSFTDKIQQADGVMITLNCGLCGQSAGANHTCAKRYLRAPRVVFARCLADPSSTDPADLFLVQLEKGGEEYVINRTTFERDYQPI